MEPSHLFYNYYLLYRIQENNGKKPQNEWRQKSPRKKSRSISSAAIVACGKLFVTIGIRLQLMVWNKEQEEASEGSAYS